MLNIWGKNIRNEKLTITFFLEGFQFVLKCPSIRFDASLGSCMVEYNSQELRYGLYWTIVAYLSEVFTISGSWKLEGKIGELGFSSTRFLTVSMFSSIIWVQEGPVSLEGGTSPEAINLLIYSGEGVLRGSWRGDIFKCFRNSLLSAVGLLNSP